VVLLRPLPLGGQSDGLAPACRCDRLNDGTALAFQPSGAHCVGLPGDARQPGQIADACPRAVEHPEGVGADGQRHAASGLVVDRECQQDPAEEWRERSLRRERRFRWERGTGFTARMRRLESAALGRMDDGEIGRWINGELLEDGPEGSLQPVDGGPPQTRAPTAIDDGWKVTPHSLRPASRLPGTHRGLVLRRVPSRLAVRWRDRHIPPTAQAAQEKLIGAGPCPQIRHGDPFVTDVLQDVGPQGERDQPWSIGAPVGLVMPGGPVRQAVLELVVDLHGVRHQSL
jgi:hypothetical protein